MSWDDFVHPTPKDYGIWAEAIQIIIDQFPPPTSTSATAKKGHTAGAGLLLRLGRSVTATESIMDGGSPWVVERPPCLLVRLRECSINDDAFIPTGMPLLCSWMIGRPLNDAPN